MPSEDFSYFLKQRPGAFVFVGCQNIEKGHVGSLHTPTFLPDEGVLRVGASLLVELALEKCA